MRYLEGVGASFFLFVACRKYKFCGNSSREPRLVRLVTVPVKRGWTVVETSGIAREMRPLFDHQAISSKSPNDYADVVSRFHDPALVRKGHPVGLSGLRQGALSQLPDLLQLRNLEPNTGLGGNERWFRFLIVECIRFHD